MAVRSYFNKTKIQGEYMILEIQFRSEKCMAVTRIRKNLEQLFILIQVIQKQPSGGFLWKRCS